MSRRNRRKKNRSTVVATPLGIAATPPEWVDYAREYGTANLGHVVLMGDSILDCKHYTKDDPDVAERVFQELGEDWKVTLAARDGAVTQSLGWQLQDIPSDATRIILSIGGNDAMGNVGILTDKREMKIVDSLYELALMREMFKYSYEDAVEPILSLGIPVTLCTIYDCDWDEQDKDAILTALALFNDVIIRFADEHDLPVIDLRSLLTSAEDYELTIEPSAIGAAKIGTRIARHVLAHAPARNNWYMENHQP